MNHVIVLFYLGYVAAKTWVGLDSEVQVKLDSEKQKEHGEARVLLDKEVYV